MFRHTKRVIGIGAFAAMSGLGAVNSCCECSSKNELHICANCLQYVCKSCTNGVHSCQEEDANIVEEI